MRLLQLEFACANPAPSQIVRGEEGRHRDLMSLSFDLQTVSTLLYMKSHEASLLALDGRALQKNQLYKVYQNKVR